MASLSAATRRAPRGGTASGTLNSADNSDIGPRAPGHYFEDIELSASAGDILDLEITATTVDTYVYLLDQNCVVIAEDDDSGTAGGGLASRISVCSAPYTGNYTVVVTSKNPGETGTYDLTWNN